MQRWHFQFQGQEKQFWESLYFLDWLHHLFKSNKLDEMKVLQSKLKFVHFAALVISHIMALISAILYYV